MPLQSMQIFGAISSSEGEELRRVVERSLSSTPNMQLEISFSGGQLTVKSNSPEEINWDTCYEAVSEYMRQHNPDEAYGYLQQIAGKDAMYGTISGIEVKPIRSLFNGYTPSQSLQIFGAISASEGMELRKAIEKSLPVEFRKRIATSFSDGQLTFRSHDVQKEDWDLCIEAAVKYLHEHDLADAFGYVRKSPGDEPEYGILAGAGATPLGKMYTRYSPQAYEMNRRTLREEAVEDPQQLRLIPLRERDFELLRQCVDRHPSAAALISKLAPVQLKDQVREYSIAYMNTLLTNVKSVAADAKTADLGAAQLPVNDLLASPYAQLKPQKRAETVFLETQSNPLPPTTSEKATKLGWFRQTRNIMRTVMASAVLVATLLNPLAAASQNFHVAVPPVVTASESVAQDITPEPQAGIHVHGFHLKSDTALDGVEPDAINILRSGMPHGDNDMASDNVERQSASDASDAIIDGPDGSNAGVMLAQWSGGKQIPLQQLDNVIKYVVDYLGFNAKDAKNITTLLREISAQESDRGTVVLERGTMKVKAFSIYQLQPRTYKSNWFLPEIKKSYPEMYEKMQSLYQPEMSASWNQQENLLYTTALAAMYVKQNVLPNFKLDTLEQRSIGYKKAYNSDKGKATPEQYIQKSKMHIYAAAKKEHVDLQAPLKEDVRLAFDRYVGANLIHSPMEAMQHIADGGRYSLVPEEFRNDCVKNLLIASDGRNIAQLEKIDRTEERMVDAVSNTPSALGVIPLDEHTDKIILAAVHKDPNALKFANRDVVSFETYCAAVERDGDALRYVPANLRAEVERTVDEGDRLTMLAMR